MTKEKIMFGGWTLMDLCFWRQERSLFSLHKTKLKVSDWVTEQRSLEGIPIQIEEEILVLFDILSFKSFFYGILFMIACVPGKIFK